jgi:hypothetical protein
MGNYNDTTGYKLLVWGETGSVTAVYDVVSLTESTSPSYQQTEVTYSSMIA